MTDIQTLLRQAHGTQRAIEDLQRLRDQMLEPVITAHFRGELTPSQHTALFSLVPVPTPCRIEHKDARCDCTLGRCKKGLVL